MASMKKQRLYLSLMLVMVMLTLFPYEASAEVPYITNSKDSNGDLVWTQPAYNPVRIIGSGLKVPDKNKPGNNAASPMLNPKDLFIDEHDVIYVADTGNNRIAVFDRQGKLQRFITVPDSPLNKPEGIFVTAQGDIYVADTGNKRVVRLTGEGKLVQEYKKPESPILPSTYIYDPVKLAVDKRGYLYIVTLGGYQGLLVLAPNGKVQSFFGSNQTRLGVLDKVKRLLYTKQMYDNEVSKLPVSISSVTMDANGLLYTTSSGDISRNQVKKLNFRGVNLLKGGSAGRFGEVNHFERNNSGGKGFIKPQLADLTVDRFGNITVIDKQYKVLSQYDANGDLLYFWGGISADSATQLGLMKSPIAIASSSNGDLFVLDDQEGIIQQFRLTEFGALVNKANAMTLQGRYAESESAWQEVLRINVYFAPALRGLGKAAYQQGNYEQARTYFYDGGSKKGYSNALWQIRYAWFQAHFSTLATSGLIAAIAWILFNRLNRYTEWGTAWRSRPKSTHSIGVQLRHIFTIIRHPIDGFAAIRHERKGSYLSAFVLLTLAFGAVMIFGLYSGYLFNPVNPQRLNLILLFTELAPIWYGWVLCHYFVSSILQGEGRYKDVFIASSYVLLPLVIVGIPLAILSNSMTLSEKSIYSFLFNGMVIWIGLLVIWNIQSIQNYTFGETMVNIGATAAAFLLAALLIFILYGLSGDLVSFLNEIYEEVRFR
ncbi:SMP-30/gluconolactonase/LRE family protein [Paenibacillus sp. BK720]|uniref:SMP-30/gluconolactonase/LRE family protein n=1 Tax=Paenibacillus sp. BK720 TaxID=2587092 RepID=UPI00141F6002|nr:SMP-30/gluconolactonase/LRE family protein [Paenibacillus sp. BK720]NIK67279.1 hypothetical protein [Paenibacillus sp. BK720]